MILLLRRFSLLFLVLTALPTLASTDWQQPTSEELNMKTYAAAPDAPAVYLFREEDISGSMGSRTLYARVKILTEKGKEMFANLEIPYVQDMKVTDIAERTIHSDGTVIPFTGKPYDKLLVKSGGYQMMAKVFSMPDVQVGSILEFRYSQSWAGAPHWLIQTDVPILKAHYSFYPAGPAGLLYSYHLPPGVTPSRMKNGGVDLLIENVPPLPDEDYLPPIADMSYRLFFYYSYFKSSDQYWKSLGGNGQRTSTSLLMFRAKSVTR